MSLSAALVLIFSSHVNALLSQPWIPHRTRWSLASLGAVSDPGLPFPEPYDILVGSKVLNASGSRTTALRGLLPARKENLFDQLPWSDSQRRGALVVLSPAFGDFDCAEYAEVGDFHSFNIMQSIFVGPIRFLVFLISVTAPPCRTPGPPESSD